MALIGTRTGSRKAQSGGHNAPNATVPFNPTSLITGAGGFWRADKGVTQSSGVTGWADQSTQGNNLSVLGGSQTNPAFSATGFNSSHPAIIMGDGGTAGLSVTFVLNSTTLSIFVLLQLASGNTQNNGRFCSLLGANTGHDYDQTNSVEFDQGSPPGEFNVTQNLGQQGNGGSAGPSLTGNGLYLLGATFDGTNANRWSAGAVVGSATSNTNTFGASSPASGWYVGSATGGSAGGAALAFIGITERAMNTTDWGNLKSWSNSNWGTSF